MPSIELLATIIASLGNLLVGIFTFLNNPKSATNKLFGFFALMVSIYLVFNFFASPLRSGDMTFFWVKNIMSVATLINLSFLLLAAAYPGEKLKLKPLNVWICCIFTILLFIGSQFNLIYKNVEISNNTAHSVPGVLIPFFLLQTLLFLGAGFYLLIKKYKTSNAQEKIQLRLFFIGAIAMFSMILITNLLFVVVFDMSQFIGLLPIYTLFFIGFIGYSIIAHGLFNLRVFASQALVVILWVVMLAKIFVSQSPAEAAVDLFVFVTLLIFGILLIRSVSTEIKHREELQTLTDKLKFIDKQKDEFLSMAAHELRAPMTAIKGYVSMVLEGDTGEIPEKARSFLADTSDITDRLIRLVNNMLNVGRIEEGRMTYQQEEEHLSVPIESVFNQFTPEAERKKLNYTLEIPNQLRDKVSVDPDRIQEVVGNFISNAIKYTNEGFVKVVMSQPDPKTVRVEVVDSGTGIAPEEQTNLFQKFYRVESNVGKTTGTGLGLYISKLLVEKFKGKIGIISDLGKGSTFWFELPLVS